MDATEQEALAAQFAVTAIGPYLAVDRERARGPLAAFAVQRVEPSALQSYWLSGSHALREIVPDPYLGWEMRDRFGQIPNDPPRDAPANFEQMRRAGIRRLPGRMQGKAEEGKSDNASQRRNRLRLRRHAPAE